MDAYLNALGDTAHCEMNDRMFVSASVNGCDNDGPYNLYFRVVDRKTGKVIEVEVGTIAAAVRRNDWEIKDKKHNGN